MAAIAEKIAEFEMEQSLRMPAPFVADWRVGLVDLFCQQSIQLKVAVHGEALKDCICIGTSRPDWRLARRCDRTNVERYQRRPS